MKTLVRTVLLLALVPAMAQAQINAGRQQADPNLPFTMTQVTTFNFPWRMAFLPDGRMVITEKVGPVWLVTQQGAKTPITNVPAVLYRGQGGMLGVFVSPHYATDHSIYLTYSEPGDGGSSLALARARLSIGDNAASLERTQGDLARRERGKGGQFGAAVAFSPDGQYLFLTSGDRQRMTPAQDPEPAARQDPAPDARRQARSGQSDGRARPARPPCPVIDPPRDTEAGEDRARGPHLYASAGRT